VVRNEVLKLLDAGIIYPTSNDVRALQRKRNICNILSLDTIALSLTVIGSAELTTINELCLWRTLKKIDCPGSPLEVALAALREYRRHYKKYNLF
jgi:hypothetical protein